MGLLYLENLRCTIETRNATDQWNSAQLLYSDASEWDVAKSGGIICPLAETDLCRARTTEEAV